jgi:hypothetical protein
VSPTTAPTKAPTMSPTTIAQRKRCDRRNCYWWSCEDWCACYQEEDQDFYETDERCTDDGDDSCVCFHHEDEEGNELKDTVRDGNIVYDHDRHDKILYRHDAQQK